MNRSTTAAFGAVLLLGLTACDGPASQSRDPRSGAARPPLAAPGKNLISQGGRSHCGPSESVIYTCAYGGKVASVCRNGSLVSYRFGAPGKPEISLTSDGKDGGVYRGVTVGDHGGDQEDQLYFHRGETVYVVYTGSHYNEAKDSEEQFSGIAVLIGGRERKNMQCEDRADHPAISFDGIENIDDEPNGQIVGWY